LTEKGDENKVRLSCLQPLKSFHCVFGYSPWNFYLPHQAKIEAEQAASEASDAAEDAEDERGDPAEDFIGEVTLWSY